MPLNPFELAVTSLFHSSAIDEIESIEQLLKL